MNNQDQVVRFVLGHLLLPYRPCGLNADWSVSAWHIGPSNEPNRVSDDFYILDSEGEDPWEFLLVRRVLGDHDEVVEIKSGSLIEVARAAISQLIDRRLKCQNTKSALK